MHNIYRLLTIILTLLSVGCGSALPTVKPFKIDIQQGNVVTSEMLLKLRPGMTKSQVKFIMGTPLLIDSFRTNRWDYFYQLRKDGKIVKQHRVILDFENDLLKRVRGDVVPKGQTVEDVTKKLQEEAKAKKAQEAPVVAEPVGQDEPVIAPIEAPDAEVTNQINADVDSSNESLSTDTPPPVVVPPVETPESVEPEPAAKAEDVPQVEQSESVVSEPVVPTEEVKPVEEALESVEQQVEEQVEQAAENVEKAIVPVPAPVEVPSQSVEASPIGNNDKRVFRMDRSLDTTRIKPPAEMQPQAVDSAVTEVVDTAEDVVPEEEPSFFERMLEKIGF